MSDHLPEIRESEAPDEIAKLYADIKAATALPQVNLIYRHLATMPGMLEWVWATLGPLYRSQELADAAAGLSRSVAATDASPIAATLSGPDLQACRAVLSVYNSGNAQNLIGLTAFVHLLDGTAGPATKNLTARRIETIGNDIDDFPPIPRRQDLPPEVIALLDRLGSRHRVVAGVIPSLYVHLALWPQVLPAVDAFLAPRLAEPGWQRQVAVIIERASETAREFAGNLESGPPPPIDQDVRSRMADTVRTFVNATIPEMVVVGRWLAYDRRTM